MPLTGEPNFVIKQGDTRPYLREILFQGGDDPDLSYYYDPTALTIKFNMKKGATNIIDHGVAYVVSEVVSVARAALYQADGYRLADGSTFVAGTYKAVEYRWETTGATTTASSTDDDMSYEWETDDGAGGLWTFPNGGDNSLTVKAQVK
jgi:hypothetical protein